MSVKLLDTSAFENKVLEKLKLPQSRRKNIRKFLNTVSYYKLLPYIEFVAENPDVAEEIKHFEADCKDNWDLAVFLYRYNIKLSSIMYAYIYILENALKTTINNHLCALEGYGSNWVFEDRLKQCMKKRTKEDFEKKINTYKRSLKENKAPELMDFIENNVTFGFWSSIVETKEIWSGHIELHRLFSAPKEFFARESILLRCKIDSVRVLRNDISHHNRILWRTIYKKTLPHHNIEEKYSLIDVYNNILDLFKVLNLPENDTLLGNLICNQSDCCSRRDFSSLYNKYAFLFCRLALEKKKIEIDAFYRSLGSANNNDLENIISARQTFEQTGGLSAATNALFR